MLIHGRIREILVEVLLEAGKMQAGRFRILDMCTGSGCVAGSFVRSERSKSTGDVDHQLKRFCIAAAGGETTKKGN